MISKVSFATPVYNNRVGFKANKAPDKNKYPKIHQAWQLAEKKEVKDAIELTVKKKVNSWEFDNITDDLNIEYYRVSDKDKEALKQTLDAQNEWQINVEDGSREVLQYYIEQISKGENVFRTFSYH